jgi:hypothetical protein
MPNCPEAIAPRAADGAAAVVATGVSRRPFNIVLGELAPAQTSCAPAEDVPSRTASTITVVQRMNHSSSWSQRRWGNRSPEASVISAQ